MTDSSITVAATGAPSWGLLRRVLFRFGLLYFVLYALPFPFDRLLQVVQDSTAWYLGSDAPLPEWASRCGEFLGAYELGWQRITSWLGEQGWVGLTVVHDPVQGSDTAHNLLKLISAGVISAVLTLVWSLLDNARPHYRRIGQWLHLGVRWYLAFLLLGAGAMKIYGNTFGTPGLTGLLEPIGDHSPAQLMATFFGFSRPYGLAIGVAEWLAAILLFHRRTSLLACVLAIPVLANILLLNLLYDLPAKLLAGHLLAFAVLLTVPEWGRLYAVFLANRAAPAVEQRLVRSRWLAVPLVCIGTVWVALHLFHEHSRLARQVTAPPARPALYGVWEVEKMLRDGKEVPVGEATRWRRLVIDAGGQVQLHTADDAVTRLHYTEDTAASTVRMAPVQGDQPPPKDLPSLAFERSEVTRRTALPDGAGQAVAEEKRTALVLKGPWAGHPIEAHLLRREFRLRATDPLLAPAAGGR